RRPSASTCLATEYALRQCSQWAGSRHESRNRLRFRNGRRVFAHFTLVNLMIACSSGLVPREEGSRMTFAAAGLRASLRSRRDLVSEELANGEGLGQVLSKYLLAVEAVRDSDLITSILLLSC